VRNVDQRKQFLNSVVIDEIVRKIESLNTLNPGVVDECHKG